MPDLSPHPHRFPDDPETLELIDQLQQFSVFPCARCGATLCPHEILASLAFGARRAPRCAPCLAAALEQSLPSLRSTFSDYMEARACYRAAWTWATDHRK